MTETPAENFKCKCGGEYLKFNLTVKANERCKKERKYSVWACTKCNIIPVLFKPYMELTK
jgi:hypothetical protein